MSIDLPVLPPTCRHLHGYDEYGATVIEVVAYDWTRGRVKVRKRNGTGKANWVRMRRLEVRP